MRLVGIVILSRGCSAESSGGGHGRVAARRSQVRPNARGVRRCSLPASSGAAASSPGQTQAGAGSAPVVVVTVRRAGMAVASCAGVCEGLF